MRWKLVTWITLIATRLSNILVRKREVEINFNELQNMPNGSLGKSFHNYLTTANISFKPNLIRHDLKHILLGYKMEMEDELRIHTFLIGNRSYNLVSMTYLGICLAIVPEMIPLLRYDFKRGRRTPCLKHINLQHLVQIDLKTCREELKIAPQFNTHLKPVHYAAG